MRFHCRELLDKVKLLEENETKVHPDKRKLQPLLESNGTLELMRIEIDRIKKDNVKLESTLQTAETKVYHTLNFKYLIFSP